MSGGERSFSVRIAPAGWTFEAPRAMTLLEAAARAGVRLASSCRNGTCRACMCRLASGNVSYRIEWPGLLPEEKAQGFILPCVAMAASDLVIEAPQAVRNSASEAHRA
ncbi:2Fe-2S iron-sulfur cluster-binding protein [Noviherbaspirillum autotrophicum]|jgi:ferredoxin|uniref:2Fe-2S ferredoxin-type domain-containing protein n=1 Tax=Noviherbaspirillum autotrophicum TaxID=709839 RepID=A0A0C1YQ71_9BURK|nr:2Fe-2S iron-sulfur cluster-binding protein [Noviherbaspirillum autotrophicum]KIF82767.1 hypothetical protein TSA66_21170 [Noviherbaspirillum autotrophicum]